jgi:hypothetical protein
MFERQMWRINGERHVELLRVAGTHRLIKMTRVTKPGRKQRFCVRLGNYLSSVGLKLQTAYGSVEGRRSTRPSARNHQDGKLGPII